MTKIIRYEPKIIQRCPDCPYVKHRERWRYFLDIDGGRYFCTKMILDNGAHPEVDAWNIPVSCPLEEYR